MSELLDRAIEAHGGLERWHQLSRLTARIAVGGGMWALKGWPGVLADASVAIDTRRMRTEYRPFVKPDQKAVFEPGRTALVAANGAVLDARGSPRQGFAGHTLGTPWDVQQLIYFAGYAMWTYLATPFLFKQPGFKTEEVAPWRENGETWRGLKVRFPDEVPSHSPEQTFYFDANGLLRRHDYSVDIMGGTSSANYASEHRSFGGLVFPTRRRVYAKAADGKPMLERVAVAIDIQDIEPS